jgi:hypothetical protein
MYTRRSLTGLVLALAAIVTVGGCAAMQPASGDLFLQGGIPAEDYRVGGGFQIRYIAPEAGVVYLVESRTHTLLGTESLLHNQVFEFFPTQEVVDGFNRVGVELAEGEFVIYFVPATRLYHR